MTSLIQQAELAHRQGDLDTAQQLYRQQLAIDAKHVDALYGLGTLLMQVEKSDAAE
jgi:thioredoxin-like negative regulator of GroEL